MKNKIPSLLLILIPLVLLGCGLARPESTERLSLPTLTLLSAESLSPTSPPPLASATPFSPASASPTEHTLTASNTTASDPLKSTAPASTATLEEPATTAPCTPPNGRESWTLYTVRAGDTLFSLAQRTGTSAGEIQQANCLTGSIILVGQPLYLPFVPPPPTDAPPAPATELPTVSITTAAPPQDDPTATPSPSHTPTVTWTPTTTVEVPDAPPPGDPRMEITPFSGPPGTEFSMKVLDFESQEQITLAIENFDTGEVIETLIVTMDADGNLTFPWKSPSDIEPGSYIVTPNGPVTGMGSPGEFEITGPG